MPETPDTTLIGLLVACGHTPEAAGGHRCRRLRLEIVAEGRGQDELDGHVTDWSPSR